MVDKEQLRQRFQQASDIDGRLYPALQLAALGEASEIEQVFSEIERGLLNFSRLRCVRENHLHQLPPTAAKRFAQVAADESRRGDVRQIAFFLSQQSEAQVSDGSAQQASAPPQCADLQEHAAALADTYLHHLAAESVMLGRDDEEAFRYLVDQSRMAALVTALFKDLLEAALEDQGYMAGNEVARLVASFGSAFVPDTLALFEVYLQMHEQLAPARAEWYRTRDDNVLFFTTNYLAVGWQLAWTLSRAGIERLKADFEPLLAAPDANRRLAAEHLLEDAIRYDRVVEPPQFGGGTGPPVVPIELRTATSSPESFPSQKVPPDKEHLPQNLANMLREIREQAEANLRRARWDAAAFWILKIPAIVAAASSGIWAHFEMPTGSIFAGGIASLCVLIDGIASPGKLRVAHLTAYHDLAALISRMMGRWRARSQRRKDETVASQIIDNASAELRGINASLRDAETTPSDKASKRSERRR
jgi:hypothetical protein